MNREGKWNSNNKRTLLTPKKGRKEQKTNMKQVEQIEKNSIIGRLNYI